MKDQKIVFWLESGEGYTIEDVCLLCDHYIETGLVLRGGMSDDDLDRFTKKYLIVRHLLIEDDGYDDIDPAGGYGLYSHV